ncbi:unnamed protein product [Trypanosoma congolense IL3000]|uniref:WGS project CAEQ00000000 data, annotated contig 338 n=1 Tax=Trypanosoma congolense (strain IL3000) TaxID=1068625 RepID=F9WF21_TRYCI|nr:unnamed protein product [Trypanosoma congolense IL3000]
MEEFYNNPFKNNHEIDDICFAPLLSVASESTTELTPVVSPAITPYADISNNIPPSQIMGDVQCQGQASSNRLQHKLEETVKANAATCDMYTSHIEAQRQEIDHLDRQNNDLQMRVAMLESQLRSVTLEKDCAAMAYKREFERNAALEATITALRSELDSVDERARYLATTYNRGVEVAQQPPEAAHAQRTQQGPIATGRQSQPRYYDPRPCSSAEGEEFSQGQARLGLHPQRQQPSLSPSSRGVVEDVRSGIGAYPGLRKGEELTEVVDKLEKKLQVACQRRDVLEAKLRKVETVRIRSGAERARKISMERELATFQKEISDIKMSLRSMSALDR